ncbi:hypothetical protein ACJX0J_021563, partial [Zea mays]
LGACILSIALIRCMHFIHVERHIFTDFRLYSLGTLAHQFSTGETQVSMFLFQLEFFYQGLHECDMYFVLNLYMFGISAFQMDTKVKVACMPVSMFKVAVKCAGQNESRHHSFQETNVGHKDI